MIENEIENVTESLIMHGFDKVVEFHSKHYIGIREFGRVIQCYLKI